MNEYFTGRVDGTMTSVPTAKLKEMKADLAEAREIIAKAPVKDGYMNWRDRACAFLERTKEK